MVASIITEYHRQQNSYNSMYQESSLLPPLFFVLITVIIIIVIILTIALITIFPSFPPQSRFLIGYASDLAIYLISSFKDNARNQWERCNLTFLLSLKVTFISHPFLLPLIIWYLPPKEIACKNIPKYPFYPAKLFCFFQQPKIWIFWGKSMPGFFLK